MNKPIDGQITFTPDQMIKMKQPMLLSIPFSYCQITIGKSKKTGKDWYRFEFLNFSETVTCFSSEEDYTKFSAFKGHFVTAYLNRSSDGRYFIKEIQKAN